MKRLLAISKKLNMRSLTATAFMSFICSSQAQFNPNDPERLARTRAMEAVVWQNCALSNYVYTMPSPVPGDGALTRVTERALAWTGGCLGGKRDGSGVLTVRTNFKAPSFEASNEWSMSGTFVAGKALGRWCFTDYKRLDAAGNVQPLPIRMVGACLFRDANGWSASHGEYLSLPNGNWARRSGGGVGSEVNETVLRDLHEQLIKSGTAGAALTGTSQELTDLVKGGRISLKLQQQVPSLEGKRIGVLLSTATESQRADYRQRRIHMLAALQENYEKLQFAADSDPQRPAAVFIEEFRRAGAIVIETDDLSELSQRRLDYALVVESLDSTRFNLTGSEFRSWPIEADGAKCRSGNGRHFAGTKLTAYLIDDKLEAVYFWNASQYRCKLADDAWLVQTPANAGDSVWSDKFYASTILHFDNVISWLKTSVQLRMGTKR